jgi:TatD DNase family protein
MILADTHAHLYLDAFDADRHDSVRRALALGVKYMLLPNIDAGSAEPMLDLCRAFPGRCFPMIGLHPTSVGPDFREQLGTMEEWLKKEKFVAIGEMGIDLYWDRTYFGEQKEAFRRQIELALMYDLPVVIHSRNSFPEIFSLLEEIRPEGLRGVFHCFTGDAAQAAHITGMGLHLGIGGVLTYKSSKLAEALEEVPVDRLLLETDAPFLAPAPHRGKRNESAFIPDIARKLAEVKGLTMAEVARITTENARKLFRLPEPLE